MPLDFANEQWVRVYRRDTVTIKLLSWDARSLLWALLRKADRAGVIDVGDNGNEGLAVLIDAPVAVVERGLPELLSRGVLRGGNGCYVFPRFLEAQETPASDAARQRESRARRRDLAMADSTVTDSHALSRAVTNRDQKSQNRSLESQEVTERHALSRAVTLRREETTREEYSQHADFAACAAEKSAELAEQSPEPKAGRGSRKSLKTAHHGLSLPFAQPDGTQEKTAATAQSDASGEVSQNATVTAKWFDRFERQTGAKPTWGKEAGAQLKRLLGIHGAEELCRRIDNAFDAPPYPHTPPADFLSFVRGVDKYATRHGGVQVKPIQQQPRPYQLVPRVYGGDK